MMRQVIVERADAAPVVAGGQLDLDDIGAHVGQQSRAQARLMRAEVEHAQPRERAASSHDITFWFRAPGGDPGSRTRSNRGSGRSSAGPRHADRCARRRERG